MKEQKEKEKGTQYLSRDEQDRIDRNKRVKQIEIQRKQLKQAKRDEQSRTAYGRTKKVASKFTKNFHKIFRPVQARPSQTSVFGKTIAVPVARALIRGGQVQQGTGRVGRPPGQFKNPAGVPAQVWYKIQRQQRRLAQIQAQRVNQARLQQMAQRGIPPQVVQQMEQQRMLQQQINQPRQYPVGQRPIQNIQQQQIASQFLPNQQIQPQAGQVRTSVQPTIWGNKSYEAQEVGPDGRVKTVIRGAAKSFWN